MGVLKEGDILQKYLIERKVAKGGMGWLYKAQHTTLKMPVAIKVLLPHHADDPGLRGRFINEARIQCRLKHPYIVQVTDTIEIEEKLGIVMEWVDGGDLLGYMQRQGELLTFQQIHAIFGPVLEALQYAHDKGVVHRDIKPDNILLQEDGGLIPKISDFGLAKLEEGLSKSWTKDGEALGSIRYMAPEQIRNTKMVDQRADIYSLGIVLYFMATGSFPFTGTPQELLYHHICQTPPRPQERNPAISFQFEDVILCCLQKDPDNRFQSCAELASALSEVSLEYAHEEGEPLALPSQRLRHERLTRQATQNRRVARDNVTAPQSLHEPPDERVSMTIDPDATAEVIKRDSDDDPELDSATRALSPDERPVVVLQSSRPPAQPAPSAPPRPPQVNPRPPAVQPQATPLMSPNQPQPTTRSQPPPAPQQRTPQLQPPAQPFAMQPPRAAMPPMVTTVTPPPPPPPRQGPPPPPAGRPLMPPSFQPDENSYHSYFDDDDDDAATVLNYPGNKSQFHQGEDDDDDATMIKKPKL